MEIDTTSLHRALAAGRERLFSLASGGHWTGELSSSALSTATAVFALHLLDGSAYAGPIERGLKWLCANQNGDGGWGDTTASPSNIATTLLAWSALTTAQNPDAVAATAARAQARVAQFAGAAEPEQIADAVVAAYGRDRTFSVPILTMAALAGRLGPAQQAWALVPQLPFELAALPHRFFRLAQLPVVSYALPALIAIGQARHHCRPTKCLLTRAIRSATRGRTLRVLEKCQPPSGGFLEAAPLTSFVAMSLASIGQGESAVAKKCAAFLRDTVRGDGSWPIDTNLATWVSTLAAGALHRGGALADWPQRGQLVDWLLSQQHLVEHPYTHAAPGGWAWTDLSGGVPDGDDTPGTLLALRALAPQQPEVRAAAVGGVGWLLAIQNRDGGIPTFCRGWGRLPFDRSSPDLTAHAIRAWRAWQFDLPGRLSRRCGAAVEKALAYLAAVQQPDGSFLPLWFGNQHAPQTANPVFGAARVLCALAEAPQANAAEMAARAAKYLAGAQHETGGWGGAAGVSPSIEETAVAVEALAGWMQSDRARGGPSRTDAASAVTRGVNWLLRATNEGRDFPAAPIGLYFARLWYHEQMYPLVFTLSALASAAKVIV